MSGSTSDTLAGEFRNAMAHVCSPVVVVTAFDGDRPHGTTVSAFMSLSMTPPMVAVALDQKSDLLTILDEGKRIGINVLAADQPDLASQFAKKGLNKFDQVDWDAERGLPRISGSSIWIECSLAQVVAGGDHSILLGSVEQVGHTVSEPLTYHARAFGTHRSLPPI
ncbi:flavin reductase [Gordonia sp. TBRC 11910]|uniref:Flavin reductase n=1 Tax=Gordonia asplenii TaxID=2725283 RepID=A0A848L1M1_9ACTN|nr:flavin reductase [Gordonia asplenii]